VSAVIGDLAPDFTLPGHRGDKVTLSQFRGEKPVVVVFIPFAFTGVCEGELCAIRDDFTPFEQGGAEVLVITCDSPPTLKRWADDQGWSFPTLSDFWPHGEVARAYDAFNDAIGCANRVTVVVDQEGRIVDRFASEHLGAARPADRYQEAMAKL
jgi:mycoredoxin-dependent peroxiredoxin